MASSPRMVLVLALAAALLLPPAASAQTGAGTPEDQVRQALLGLLRQQFDPASAFEISVVGVAMTDGTATVEDVLITGKPAVLRGVPAEILLHVTALALDAPALARGEGKILTYGRATMTARSTAAAVQEGLAKVSPNLLAPKVHFQAGEFVVTATVRREGNLYPVMLRGQLEIENGRRIRVRVAQAQVSGGDVPLALVAGQLERFDPLLDLAQWPLNLRVDRLILHNDAVEMLLTGSGG